MTYKAEIPYGAYWSTPFTRWQGSLRAPAQRRVRGPRGPARTGAAQDRRRALRLRRARLLGAAEAVVLRHALAAGLIGAGQAGGPTLMQACATGVRTLLAAAQEIEVGMATTALVVNCDRTSNGPHLYYPNPRGPGGTGVAEDWVMDNFGCDPLGGHSMLATAENVAARHGITTAEQHEVVLRREAQYAQALADGSAFLKRFMTLPFEVPAPGYKKTLARSKATRASRTRRPRAWPRSSRSRRAAPSPSAARRIRPTATRRSSSRRASRRASWRPIRRSRCGCTASASRAPNWPTCPRPPCRRRSARWPRPGAAIGQMAAVKTHNPFADQRHVLRAQHRHRPGRA